MAADPRTMSTETEPSATGKLGADALAPRPLVPTPRQRAAGERGEAYEFTQEVEAGKPLARGRMADNLRRIDPRTIAGPKLPLFVFGMLALLGPIDDLIFLVIGPEIRADFAAAPAALGIMAGVVTAVQYAVLPFYGWLVDRVKRVHLVRLANIAGNTVSALSAFGATAFGFIALRGAAGLLGRGDDVPKVTLLTDYYEEESLGRAMTLIQAMGSMATIIAPLLGGILVAATNWRVGVFVLGGIATLAGLSTLLLREPERGGIERRALQAASSEAEPQGPPSFTESWRMARSVHTLRRIWYATPFQVASTSATVAVVVPLFFAEVFGLTAAERGYVAAASGAVGVLALLALGPFAGRMLAQSPGRLMTTIGGLMVLQAVAMGVLGMSTFLPLAIIAALPLTLGMIVILPLQQMITAKVVPPRMRGLGFSTTAPWVLLGFVVIYVVLASGGGSARTMAFLMIPVQLTGAFFFATGARGVEHDIRAARASVLAERAVREAKETGRAKLLVCRDVEAAYEGTQVLFGVDLDVEEGEILALLGTNGAGKSTLLRAIAGVHHASNGAILVDGRDVTHEPGYANAARGVVLMPGGRATFPTLTVRENLRSAAWLYRSDEQAVARRLGQVLQLLPVLSERLSEAAGNLSGGEQQMVGLAQAFLMRPRLLMIDELSLGLAPSLIEKLLEALRAIHEQGTTIILVEQSLNVALTIAERAVFMEKGEVRFDGPTEELLRRPDLIRSVFIAGASATRTATRMRSPGAPGDEGARGTLSVQDIHVRFGGVHALRGVSIDVRPGEIVGLIGPNGAGKTTLFDVISGFLTPERGRVVVDGHDVTTLPAHARARLDLGRSFQNVRLFPSLTARENIAVAFEHRTVRSEIMTALWLPNVRKSESKVFQRVDGLIEMLGLEAFADKFVGDLSTGSRRAVEVACMMAAEPRVLLLDEPSSGLAQAETEELGPVLVRLVRQTGCGLFMIEHDVRLIASISDRLVAMELGSVIAAGTPDQVLADPRVLASYLAASEQVIARSGTPLARIAAALGQGTGHTDGTSGPAWRQPKGRAEGKGGS